MTAIDFPNAPTVGQQFTVGGAVWVWDGAKWTVGTGGPGVYLPLTGGTMTGPIAGTSAVFSGTIRTDSAVNIVGAAGTTRNIDSYTAPGLGRWQLVMGDNTAESGSNAGSDFNLVALADAGTYLSTPLAINRATGVATFSQPIVQPSARALKTDIEPVADALAIVEKLEGVFFRMKDAAKRHVGLIAEDVAPVLPEVVFPSTSSGQASPGVAYAQIVAVLVNACKELAAKNKTLEARMSALETAP